MPTTAPSPQSTIPERDSQLRSALSTNSANATRLKLAIASMGLAMAAAMLVTLGWYQARGVVSASEELIRSTSIVNAVHAIRGDVRSAEQAQQSYFASATRPDVTPLRENVEKLRKDFAQLPQPRLRIPADHTIVALRDLLSNNIKDYEQSVETGKMGGASKRALARNAEEGRQFIEQIDKLSLRLQEEANERLRHWTETVQMYNRSIGANLPISLCLLMLLGLLLPYFTVKYYLDKRRAESSLAYTYRMFESFMDNTPTIAFMKDTSGRYIYNNKYFEERLKARGIAILGIEGYGWLDERAAALAHETDKHVLETSKPCEFQHNIQVDGKDLSLFVIKFPLRDPFDKPLIGCVAIDITKAVKAEQQIEKLDAHLQQRVNELELLTQTLELARDEAAHASKLKSQFMANLSHEIRTPMSGLMGMSELLLDQPLDDESRELVQFMHDSATALLVVVNQLLDFSRLEAGRVDLDISEMSVRTLVGDVAKSIAPTALQKNLKVRTQLDPDLPEMIQTDVGKLRQVLLNIVNNAAKFTEEGSISITAEPVFNSDATYIKFTVEDTGIGIPEEAMNSLFEPFYQVDGTHARRYGGTGLGLSISKALVGCMSGSITVVSEPGFGSRFSITIPVVETV